MAIDFDFIKNTMQSAVQARETELRSTLEDVAANPTDMAKMQNMQIEIQRWTLMINTQSTLVKELGDTLKGIVQKAA